MMLSSNVMGTCFLGRGMAHHAAEDAQKVVLIEAAVQEKHCKQRCKQHLCAAHHLIYAGCHAQQADIHEHRGDEVKDCGNCQEQELKS